MKAKQTKEKQKKTKKQLTFQIITIVAIVFAGIASGFYCGNLYLSTKHKKVDYSKFKESDFLPNFDEVLARNSGKSVSEVSPIDAFLIAQYNLEHAPMFSATSFDTITHNYGKQTVYVYKHKYNGVMLTKEVSCSSMKNIAKKTKVENGKAYIYTGDATSDKTANWSENFKEFSPEDYKNTVGLDINGVIPFIVSEKTVHKDDANAFVVGSGTKLANGNMRFSIMLNNDSAVMNYVKKIKYMSELSDTPSFSKLEISFEIDKNFNFVSVSSIEVYSFKYLGGIFVTCSGGTTTHYDFKTIPSEI